MTSVFGRAAALLEAGEPARLTADAEARQLLSDLGYLSPGSEEATNQAALLRAAAWMRRLFRLPVQHAPGLVFLGGEADPAIWGESFAGLPVGSLAGSGLTLREAFESCVGEGVEYLSQFEQVGDVVDANQTALPLIEVFPEAAPGWPADKSRRDGLRARHLATGDQVLLPADRCLRRAASLPPPFALSTGCGAGPTFAAAALHGLLELVERDAAALWWRGGRRARPLGASDEAHTQRMLVALRQGCADRRTRVLDITTDLGIPCAAAVSFGADGRGFACGTAARLQMPMAIWAALKEMCHIELAYDVIASKRAERGDAALNEADRRHLRRGREVRPDLPQLQPDGPPGHGPQPAQAASARPLETLIAHLAERQIEVFGVDLSRAPLSISAVQVVAPSLQLDPSPFSTNRLIKTIDKTGSGQNDVHEFQLF